MSWGRGYGVLFAALVAASFFYMAKVHAATYRNTAVIKGWYESSAEARAACEAAAPGGYCEHNTYGYSANCAKTSADPTGGGRWDSRGYDVSEVVNGDTYKTEQRYVGCNNGFSNEYAPAGPEPSGAPLGVYGTNPNLFPDELCDNGTRWYKSGLTIEPAGSAPGTFYTAYWSKGESCSDALPSGVTTGEATPDNCITSAAGNMVCGVDMQAPANCGTVNGEATCLDSVPDGKCTILAGGSFICDGAASTPPKPNNGTEGMPAPIDETLFAKGPTGLQSFSYYSSTTVNNSTSHQGVPVSGDGTAQDPGEPQTFEEVTDHSAYGNADTTEADSITSGYGDALDKGQIAQPSASRVYSWSGVGQVCAVGDWSFDYMGHSLTMDLCPAWDMIQTILYWAFAVLTAWYLYEVWTHTFRRAA